MVQNVQTKAASNMPKVSKKENGPNAKDTSFKDMVNKVQDNGSNHQTPDKPELQDDQWENGAQTQTNETKQNNGINETVDTNALSNAAILAYAFIGSQPDMEIVKMQTEIILPVTEHLENTEKTVEINAPVVSQQNETTELFNLDTQQPQTDLKQPIQNETNTVQIAASVTAKETVKPKEAIVKPQGENKSVHNETQNTKVTKEDAQTSIQPATDNPVQKAAKTENSNTIKNEEAAEQIKTEEPKSELVSLSEQEHVSKQNDVIEIKVGDGKEIKPEDMNEPLAKKIEDIIVKSTGKDNEFEIQLMPEHLGKILIKVAFKQGQTNVSLYCSDSKTMNLLAENAKGISQIVEGNTGNHATVTVQEDAKSLYQEQNNGGNGQHNQKQQQQQNNKQQASVDFIQQLRLGLVDIGGLEEI